MPKRWRNKDDVAIHELGIRGVTPLSQEAIQIELGHHFARAFELDTTHRAHRTGATGCE